MIVFSGEKVMTKEYFVKVELKREKKEMKWIFESFVKEMP
jgi:hypothetical protein